MLNTDTTVTFLLVYHKTDYLHSACVTLSLGCDTGPTVTVSHLTVDICITSSDTLTLGLGLDQTLLIASTSQI